MNAIIKFFRKKKFASKNRVTNIDAKGKIPPSCELIYSNNYIGLSAEAARICYNSAEKSSESAKLKYIENKVKAGHESVIEHTNIVVEFTVDKNSTYIDHLIDFISAAKFLYVKHYTADQNDIIVLSGSILGFKQLIRRSDAKNNIFITMLIFQLYKLPKQFFYDFIYDGIMQENLFKYFENKESNTTISDINKQTSFVVDKNNNQYLDIISYSNYDNIIERYPFDDAIDMITISVVFSNMSRACCQQVNRHRNATSMQSQRYVKENNFNFIYPDAIQNEKLDNILAEIQSNYNNLINQGYKPEDARSILPMNCASKQMISFTLRNAIHFCKIRTEHGAQSEVRKFAEVLKQYILNTFGEKINEDNFNDFLLPRYDKDQKQFELDNTAIDEVEEFEEIYPTGDMEGYE